MINVMMGLRFAAFWTALMFIYLLGDVMRIFSGSFTPGMIGEEPASEGFYLMMACIMLVPIAMILISVLLPYKAVIILNIIVAVCLFLFNLTGLKTYPQLFDRFLIIAGLAVNALTVCTALLNRNPVS